MATRGRKKKEDKTWITESYPYTVIGTHLNVTYHKDGITTLEWDDEALEREVREAIASVENKNRKGK